MNPTSLSRTIIHWTDSKTDYREKRSLQPPHLNKTVYDSPNFSEELHKVKCQLAGLVNFLVCYYNSQEYHVRLAPSQT